MKKRTKAEGRAVRKQIHRKQRKRTKEERSNEMRGGNQD